MEELTDVVGENPYLMDDIPKQKGPKKYQIIYADPPWSYKVWSEDKKAAKGCAKRHYDTMDIDDICALPVQDIADKDCKLFLWATPPCLQEAMRVMASWGFQYKTIAFSWVKLNKTGQANSMFFTPADMFYGIGHWTASNTEIVLAGLKPGGCLNRQRKDIGQVVLAPRRKHGQKPDIIREYIASLCGDVPRIELFARERTPGWDVWGNEVESDIELTVTKEAHSDQ